MTETAQDRGSLLTPEQVAARIGGATKAKTLRRLARQREVPHVRGARNKILFTEGQVQILIDYWTVPASSAESAEPVESREDLGLIANATGVSRARSRS